MLPLPSTPIELAASSGDEALDRLERVLLAGRERVARDRAAGHPGPRPQYLAGWFDQVAKPPAGSDTPRTDRSTSAGAVGTSTRSEVRRQATLAVVGYAADVSLALPAVFESPLEERLASYAERVIRADARYETQVEVATLAGTFRLDAVLSVGSHRIGLEVDGSEYHSSYEQQVRDTWRDALILGSQAVTAIYRLPGYAVDHWPYETLEAVCLAERRYGGVEWCSSRGAQLLPSVRSPAAHPPVMPHQGGIRVEFDRRHGLYRWDRHQEDWVVADGITEDELHDYLERRCYQWTSRAGPGAEHIEWRGITVRRHAFSTELRTPGARLRAVFCFALEQGAIPLDQLRRAWARRMDRDPATEREHSIFLIDGDPVE